MTTPAIQNDFSYYRRTLSRMKMSDNVRIIQDVDFSGTLFDYYYFLFLVGCWDQRPGCER